MITSNLMALIYGLRSSRQLAGMLKYDIEAQARAHAALATVPQAIASIANQSLQTQLRKTARQETTYRQILNTERGQKIPIVLLQSFLQWGRSDWVDSQILKFGSQDLLHLSFRDRPESEKPSLFAVLSEHGPLRRVYLFYSDKEWRRGHVLSGPQTSDSRAIPLWVVPHCHIFAQRLQPNQLFIQHASLLALF